MLGMPQVMRRKKMAVPWLSRVDLPRKRMF